jgi:hypothetical protein
MIIVLDDHGGEHEFDATRFATEDHVNNLMIFSGDRGDRLCAVFAAGKWVGVRVAEED